MDKATVIVEFIKSIFQNTDFVPLHEPCFLGKEKQYVLDCIDSTFVSSVGKYVDLFEQKVAEYTDVKYAIATVNGTAALHMALLLAGVQRGDEVLTQAISFVATANAIRYCGAQPVFLDSDRSTLGLSPGALEQFLMNNCDQKDDGYTYNQKTGNRIAACVPVHVLGHPAKIDQIENLCDKYRITLIEDAAESVGSLYKDRHTGSFGKLGILSFNGNKTITTGSGGMILTNDKVLAQKAKHLTTTAKVPHPWEYTHDYIGYNYRLANINAALGCAQIDMLSQFLKNKRELASMYQDFFKSLGVLFITDPENSRSNYWLNAIVLDDLNERNSFLEFSNTNGVMTRPIWTLLPKLPMYAHCQTDGLENARWLEERLVKIPSSVRS